MKKDNIKEFVECMQDIKKIVLSIPPEQLIYNDIDNDYIYQIMKLMLDKIDDN